MDASGHAVTVKFAHDAIPIAGDLDRSTAAFTRFMKPQQFQGVTIVGRVYTALIGIWMGVAVCLLGWLVLCYHGVYRLCRRASPAMDGNLAAQLAALCSARAVCVPALLVSADVESVFIAGVRQPAILLPAAYETRFDPVTLNAILAHEVMHLRVRDGYWMLLTRHLCALLWMQPLLWWICRRREQASEEVCDQAVVEHGCAPCVYADCLVTLAEQLQPSRLEWVASSGSIVFRSSLASRVQRLLGSEWRRSVPVTARFRLGVGLVCVLLHLALSFTVSAAPLQSSAGIGNDGRLGRKVTISAEGVPIGDLLTLVTKKSGVNMSAAPDVADDKIIIFETSRRLRDAMADIAALYNAVWVPVEVQGSPVRYSLVVSAHTRQYEEDLADETTRRILARLDEQVQALSESPQQFAKRAPNDSIRRALSTSDGRAATSVFASLSPQQRRLLIDRHFVRFPVDALTAQQKDQIEELYHGKRLDELNDNDLVKRGVAIPNAAVSRAQMDQQEVTFTVNQIPGHGGRGADLMISMGASTGLSMEMTQIHTDVGFLIAAHGDPYTGQPLPRTVALPDPKDVSQAQAGAWPDRLRALAEKTSRPVLADYYRSRSVFTADAADQAGAQPGVSALDAFCRPQGYLWWTRDNTLLFRKRDWYTQRLYEVPDRWLDALTRRLKAQKNELTIDDVLSLRQLTTNQIAGLNGSMGIASDPLAMSGLRELLALVAAIPGDKTKPLYDGIIGGNVPPSRYATMPDLANVEQRALLDDFVQAWQRKIDPAGIKQDDWGIILQADHRPEYVGNQVRTGIHIYQGKGTISFGYWIALPLVIQDDRRDRTIVEIGH
jgi:beta-lactamase regulating signal transducer with metallopeptidase domain